MEDAWLLLGIASEGDTKDPFARALAACVGLGDGPVRLLVPRAEDLEFFGDAESAELFAQAIAHAS